jgi:hypothetical protein
LLNPYLNGNVKRGVLSNKSIIKPVFVSLKNQQGEKALLLKDYEEGTEEDVDFESFEKLEEGWQTFTKEYFDKHQEVLRPLFSTRIYYLPLHIDDEFEEHDKRIQTTMPRYEGQFDLDEAPFIVDSLLSDDNSRIVGRILIKSSLKHFGYTSTAVKLPCLFTIMIGDAKYGNKSVIAVTFFGATCLKYFVPLKQGQIIVLEGYSIRECRSSVREDFQNLKVEYELHVNDTKGLKISNLSAENVLNYDSQKVVERFPLRDVLFIMPGNEKLEENADTKAFDICGRVQYVSDVYHQRITNPRERMFKFCWVRLFIHHSLPTVLVKLRSESQSSVFEK